MTLKNTLISVAASALLISAITGCSSDSTTTPPPSTEITQVTVTDGYVINYTATATISDGNSSTTSNTAANVTSVPLPLGVTHSTKVAGAAATAGSAVIDLTKDLTATQRANLVSISVAPKLQTTGQDGTINYATFFDANGDGTFSTANGDVLAPGIAMSAPVGYKNITPITTLVNARITTLTTGDTNDTARSTDNAAALATVVSKLGITADKIQNVDPMDTISADPAYALTNAMLGALTAGDMTTLSTYLAATTTPAATTAAAALTNVANSGITAATAAWFASAATQLAADSTMINSVSSWNLDATRAALGATFAPVNSAAVSSDYNVTAITFTNNNAANLAGAGAKLNTADFNALDINLTSSSDTNISMTNLTLVIHAGSQQLFRSDDVNTSSITISVPLEMNNTIGATNQINARLSTSRNVTYEGVDATGATFTGEMNATAFGTTQVPTVGNAGDANIVVPANSGTQATGAGISFNIDSIISTVDANSSNKFNSSAAITDVRIALVDNNSSLARVNATNTAGTYWGNTVVSSVLGGINETGKTILKNSLVDKRSGGAVINVAPQNALVVTSLATANYGMTGTGTASDPYILQNNMDLTLNPGTAIVQMTEANTTATFTMSGTAAAGFDLNTTELIADIKGGYANRDAAAAAGSDYNSSTANLTKAGDVNATLTTVFTDEFDESNTTAYYFMIDRPAYVTATAFDTDSNSSQFLSDYDTNTTLSIITAGTIRIVDNSGESAYIAVNGVDADLNLSTTNDTNYSIFFSKYGVLEINATLNASAISDLNFTITDVNVTDIHGVDFNISSTTGTDSNTTY